MNSASSAWTRTAGLIRQEQSTLAVATTYSVAIGLLSLVMPVAIQSLVNTVAFGSVLQPILVLTTLVAAALAASAVLNVLRTIVLETMQRRIFVRQASDVLDSLLRYRVPAADSVHVPELVNRFLDVTTVQKSATALVVDGLTVVMQTLVGVVLLAAYHPYLLVFDILLIAAILTIIFVFGRGAVTTSIDESRAKYAVLAWFEEVARHSPALRSPLAAQFAAGRADAAVRAYLHHRSRHFRIILRQTIGAQSLQALALASLLGVGGYLVIGGELTLGQLVAAELVVGMAVSSFAKFGKSLETFYDLQAALDKLEHLTELPLERNGGTPKAGLPSGPATLALKGITFGYDPEHPVVEDADINIAAGDKIAIHGESAAGKSTLMDLIFALREPNRGRLELDGIDYRHLTLEEVRESCLLLRGVEIFPGTVEDNVTLGVAASAGAVRKALDQAGILEVVNALPEGLNTKLEASGRPLAPSQALRLMFARAFLRRPRVLLIDEALDEIADLRTDGHIVRTIFSSEAPWTAVIATEREDLWPYFDSVYNMAARSISHGR